MVITREAIFNRGRGGGGVGGQTLDVYKYKLTLDLFLAGVHNNAC